MNTMSTTQASKDMIETQPLVIEQALNETWFDEPAPGSIRPSQPPTVRMGEFLGDPLADSWLR